MSLNCIFTSSTQIFASFGRENYRYSDMLDEIFLFFLGLLPNCFKKFSNFFFFIYEGNIEKSNQNIMKFTEDQIKSWAKPASNAEDTRMNNSRDSVQSALQEDTLLDDSEVKIIDKGSSRNNTNVKLQADVDLSLVQEGDFFYDLPAGYTKEYFGIIDGRRSFKSYKNSIINAIYNFFKNQEIDNSKDKCTRIKENSNRADIDVVPVWRYRLYQPDKSYHEGVAFYSDSNVLIINFPEQHTKNGNEKNNSTGRKYKRIVRILKRLKNKMEDDGILVSDSITSFLIESLVWNVEDNIFNESDSLSDILRNVLVNIYNNSLEDWHEVSDILKLFHAERKWSILDVKTFIKQVWKYGNFE